jgi:hypothetical protein
LLIKCMFSNYMFTVATIDMFLELFLPNTSRRTEEGSPSKTRLLHHKSCQD